VFKEGVKAMSNYYQHFQNIKCEYYPCHVLEKDKVFNCLFCYCPLYALGDKCGGFFTYTDKGIKNCTDCSIPHDQDNYDQIINKLEEIIEMVKNGKAGQGSD